MDSTTERSPTSATDLVDRLQELALTAAQRCAYVFLEDGEHEAARLTFSQLDLRARAIAAGLQMHCERRARVLLLFPPGLDYIEAFLGCLYAGVIAVPAYPPTRHHLGRLSSIVSDAAPALTLTTAALREQLHDSVVGAWGREAGHLLASDRMATADAPAWRAPTLHGDDVAFLQYTSGSTAAPKGVMVSHGNLMANQAAITAAFEHTRESVVVGWLPLYHDMGLIGNVLQPLYLGAQAVLMSPLAFMARPVRWLRAITRYRATTSGAPNFAYDYCVRRSTAVQRAGLALDSWRVAFNGAEPIDPGTLERFARTFAASGFARRAFYPCYGLAEATLLVTGPVRGSSVRTATLPSAQDRPVQFVGCGQPAAAHALRIVDPERETEVAAGQEGEIWLSGPSVARGYFGRSEETASVFAAQLPGESAAYLRTGDLGFVRDGSLFVTGRLRDLIIVRGRNYHPHDIERVVNNLELGLRPDSCVAFAGAHDEASHEGIVLLAELGDERAASQAPAIFDAIRQGVATHSDAPLARIVLVARGAVLKTSSGKLRRGACRAAYLHGLMRVVAESPAPTGAATTLSREQASEPLTASTLLRRVQQHVAGLLRQAPDTVDASAPLASLGMNSLQTVDLQHQLERWLGRELALRELAPEQSLASLCQTWSREPAPARPPPKPIDSSSSCELSAAQRLIWTAQQLEPTGCFYNLHLAVRLAGPLEPDRLRSALQRMVARHDALRSVVDLTGDGTARLVHVLDALAFENLPAHQLSPAEVDRALLDRVRTPFDLRRGPLLRASLFRHGLDDHTLLLCAHHLAVDLWSLLLLQKELVREYCEPGSNALAPSYATFTGAQRSYLASDQARKDREYWQQQLDASPALRLPYDHARAELPVDDAAARVVRLGGDALAGLRTFARDEGVTLYVLLLTAYKVLLHRYTQQTDLVVGTPTHGRTQAALANVVGNCVNPLALRTRPRARLPFREFLRHVHSTLAEASEHGQFPFLSVVEQRQPERIPGEWPIYQTWFALQRAQPDQPGEFAELALGVTGEGRPWGPWTATGVELPQHLEPFDLALMTAEAADSLVLSFRYRPGLFEHGTIARMADGFVRLLQAAVAAPDTRLSDLPLLGVDELRRATAGPAQPLPREGLGASLIARFEEQVARTPHATAVLLGERALSYAELNARANRVAHHLLRMGTRRDSVVGLCARRSFALVSGILGILKAGAAYLALDPDHPSSRLQQLAGLLTPRTLVVQRGLEALVAGLAPAIVTLDEEQTACAAAPTHDPGLPCHPMQLCYVLFTSGSTGQPKAVGVPQEGLLNRLGWMQALHDLGPDEVVLQKTPFSFDVSVWELFWPLIAGARLVLAEPDAHKDPEALLALIARHGVTTVHFVPSMLGAFLESPSLARANSLRRIVCSGEPLPRALVDRSHERLAADVYNLYGPTEASIDVTAARCPRGESSLPITIGRAVTNTSVYVLDAAGQPVPRGAIGELHIAGRQLARGYLQQPDLTAERFVPDPFGPAGSRMYRSGDLVRQLPDGQYDFVGRSDQQLKIRGVRVEPAEVEHALRQDELVAEVAVRPWLEPGQGARLVAYVALRRQPNAALDPAQRLSARLRAALPEQFVPATFMFVPDLPRSASGKLDLRALPEPTTGALQRAPYQAPQSASERALAALFAELLRVDQVGLHDNFFSLGGDSILAIGLTARARQLGLELTPRDLFRSPTVSSLARTVSLTEHTTKGPACTTPDPAQSSLSALEWEALPYPRHELQDVYPLTSLQEGLLFHSLAHAGGAMYHMQDRYTLVGPLDVALLERALEALVDQHPVLRSSFAWQGLSRPQQLVHRKLRLPFEYIDLGQHPPEAQRQQIDSILAEELRCGFDLTRTPLLRVRLVRLAEDRHWLIRSHHHILMDAWCTSLWLRDCMAHYRSLLEGRPAARPGAPPFHAYVTWLATRDRESARAYFRRSLAGFLESTPLVIAGSAAEQDLSTMADCSLQLTEAETLGLTQAARGAGVTLNTLVQAAFALLLGRYADCDDVLFGVTVAGRPVELAGIEDTLGLFINSLPLRVHLAPQMRLAHFLVELQAQNAELRHHEYLPLREVQAVSEIARGAPLFQHLLVFENAPIDPSLQDPRAPLHFASAESRTHTNYPITAVVVPGKRLQLQLSYAPAMVPAEAARRMLVHFERLLLQLTGPASTRLFELDLLPDVERQCLLADAAMCAAHEAADVDLGGRLAAYSRRTPASVAVACGSAELTYAQLHAQVRRVAAGLRAREIGPEQPVAVWAERSCEFVVMLLAILDVGAVYVPLEPALPDARIDDMLARCKPALVLVDAARAQRLQASSSAMANCRHERLDTMLAEQAPVREHSAPAHPAQLAYVIFTSGSTGRPKGAMVHRGGLENQLASKVRTLALTERDVIAQTASQAFDISVWQLLVAVLCGARVQIYPDAVAHDPLALWPALTRDGVTVLECVPALLRGLLENEVSDTALRWLLPTGEAVPPELCREFVRRYPHVALLNAYGPAECSDDVAYHTVQPSELMSGSTESVPIGRAIQGLSLYVLDAQLELLPVGVPGELCIAGVGVGRGYLGSPELSSAAFVPHPFGAPGERLYRSGDRVRRRSDGVLEFLGRVDEQVKVNGHRIEPGEIEACLRALPGVQDACVVARPMSSSSAGPRGLVAYVVCSRAGSIEADSLLPALRQRLPDYMLPRAFVQLEALPRNTNGKLDRAALPAPDLRQLAPKPFEQPCSPAELALAAVWQQVLRIPRVGQHDNFFDLGGDSILSIQIVSRARAAGWLLDPRQVFERPVLAQLAAAALPLASTPIVHGEAGEVDSVALTAIQRWFFAQRFRQPAHWNQAVLLRPLVPLDRRRLERAAAHVVRHHAALRSRFHEREGSVVCSTAARDAPVSVDTEDLSDLPAGERTAGLAAAKLRWQASLELSQGPVFRVVLLTLGADKPAQVLVVAHHLVIDGVSFRVLLDDLLRSYAVALHEPLPELPQSSSFAAWAARLHEYAQLREPEPYWDGLAATPAPRLHGDHPEVDDLEAEAAELRTGLDRASTEVLLQLLPRLYRARIQEVIVAALARALCRWQGAGEVQLDLEGHGREQLFPELDVSHTVGWFTTLFPVRLTVTEPVTSAVLLRTIKEQLRAVPHQGIGYGLSRHLREPPLAEVVSDVSFNYLGQLQSDDPGSSFQLSLEQTGDTRAASARRTHALEVVCFCLDGTLQLRIRYGRRRFEQSTILTLWTDFQAELRGLIDHARLPGVGGASRSDFPLSTLGQDELDMLVGNARNVEDVYPLGPMQEGLLLHTLLAPESGIYLMQDRYELHGQLEVDIFRRAWQQVVANHSVLRTGFHWRSGSRPHQVVYREVELPLLLVDLRGLDATEQRVRIDTELHSELRDGLPLERAPLLRLRLFRTADERYLFARSHHHILLDAWCLSPLLVEFSSHYHALLEGRLPERRSMPSYRDYIEFLARQDTAGAASFFGDYLRGFTQPTFLANPPTEKLPDGEIAVADVRMQLTRQETERLHEIARERRLTPNTFVQAAWALLVSRCTDRDDVLFGVTVAGRPPELAGIEDAIGLFINTLPLRLRVPRAARLGDWLQTILSLNLQLRQYEHTPLLKIQQQSELPAGQPLFDSFLVFENVPVDPSLRSGRLALDIVGFESRTHTNYPLTVVVVPDDELLLQLTYDRRSVSTAWAEELVLELHTLLRAMLARPDAFVGEIALFGASAASPALARGDRLPTPEPSLLRAFSSQVSQSTDAVAIADSRSELSYGDLEQSSERVAQALCNAGLVPEDLVAVYAARASEYLVTLLGVLKAGGVYLPIDPAFPAQRSADILKHARPRWASADTAYAPALLTLIREAGVDTRMLPASALLSERLAPGKPRQLAARQLAYVIHTSGSTGTPKGALIEHAGLWNNLATKLPALGLSARDRIAQTASQSFDISIWQFLSALLCGARIEVFDDQTTHDPARLARALEEREITVFEAVPSMIEALLDAPYQTTWPRLRWLIPSGEALNGQLASRFRQRCPQVRVLNAYGPAECADDVSYHELADDDFAPGSVPIGRAVEHARLSVLNRWLEPVPHGMPGEICVSGLQVGRGYLHAPDQTAAQFVPDPSATGRAAGGRLYRTGDFGRFRADGVLEFLGRRDQQVKIRGVRIELAEIEACLRSHPALKDAAVLVGPAAARLVAYVVPYSLAPTPDALRSYTRAQLPEPMVPSQFVLLAQLPRTAAGKLDRRALHALAPRQPAREHTPPRNHTEAELSRVWSELLGLSTIGVHDNFFELGGHSLLATQILYRMQATFDIELPLRAVLEVTTIAELAERVDLARLANAARRGPSQANEQDEDVAL
jgi:amino acid adenylation domain-containing protein/non-ribosomal peptide synthase protein (TIGR01720 family)